MLYFEEFENITYNFGDEVDPVIFQNISIYADVVDTIKNSISFLNVHTIQEGFRPDQVSLQIYGTPLYYWTFYLLNDDIREQGWPLPRYELEEYVHKAFPNTTLTTRDANLATKFKVGQTISGGTSSASGKIIKRNIDLGQIVVEGNVSFSIGGELLTSTNSSGIVETLTSVSSSKEYQAASHYIDGSSAIVDIDPAVGPGALLTEQTNENVYFNVNDSLRQIKIIKPSQIINLISSFKQAIRD
jgi:hypothetical protein|tara:strand:- start:698 stop:1429 length:732 start_codon:yes stop_codon:yes gene_type:complete